MNNKKSEIISGFWVWVLVAVIAILVASAIIINSQGSFEQLAQKFSGLKYG